jgi:WD40 repeat protein
LSACAVSPDGKLWLSGSMEGLLSVWESISHQKKSQFVAHARPISSIQFSPGGDALATAGWDRAVCWRHLSRDREGRSMSDHLDVVSGCKFTPDGQAILSWSHDRTLKLWHLGSNAVITLRGHQDRVMAGDLSPDGSMALSGGRDGTLRLWDLKRQELLRGLEHPSEIRACFFLRVCLLSIPELQLQTQDRLNLRVVSAALSPRGDRLALGCEDGQLRLLLIEGRQEQPLFVTATQDLRDMARGLKKMFGIRKMVRVFKGICPACNRPIELLGKLPTDPTPCPHCRHPLRFNRALLGQGSMKAGMDEASRDR